MKLKVIKVFKDKANPEKTYKVGEFLSVDELDRINNLVSRNLCIIESVENEDEDGDTAGKVKLFDKEFEPKEVRDALKTIGVTIANNAKVETIEKKVSELSEEQTKAIKEILCKE